MENFLTDRYQFLILTTSDRHHPRSQRRRPQGFEKLLRRRLTTLSIRGENRKPDSLIHSTSTETDSKVDRHFIRQSRTLTFLLLQKLDYRLTLSNPQPPVPHSNGQRIPYSPIPRRAARRKNCRYTSSVEGTQSHVSDGLLEGNFCNNDFVLDTNCMSDRHNLQERLHLTLLQPVFLILEAATAAVVTTQPPTAHQHQCGVSLNNAKKTRLSFFNKTSQVQARTIAHETQHTDNIIKVLFLPNLSRKKKQFSGQAIIAPINNNGDGV